MPTRISAGVGDHPCFLTFITVILIDCKLLIFSYNRNSNGPKTDPCST